MLTLALATGSARAAEPSGAGRKNGASLSSLVDEGQRWLTAASAGPTVASEPTVRNSASGTLTAEPDRARERPSLSATPFLDLSPFASVVARDWRGSLTVVGRRSMLVDDLRPTASTRMVMTRIATDARLTFFAQIGIGEWRIDPVMFPNARSYSEAAGQLGGGFELRLTRGTRVAGEVQYTMLHRDLIFSADEVPPRMGAFILAIDGRF